jgi:hypothetical protein
MQPGRDVAANLPGNCCQIAATRKLAQNGVAEVSKGTGGRKEIGALSTIIGRLPRRLLPRWPIPPAGRGILAASARVYEQDGIQELVNLRFLFGETVSSGTYIRESRL